MRACCLHRSPSQSHHEFSSFITNLESTLQILTLRKSFLAMVLGDFNATNKLWLGQIILHTKKHSCSYEGLILNDLMVQYSFTQIIHELTHVFESSVSCTANLVFTSQENVVTNSGVHGSLHPSCHHQIVFSNFNLMRSNADLIKRTMRDFNWENKLSLIGINDQVALFNETILSIVSNFTPNETMIFDDRDPPWLDKNIKNIVNYRNAIYKKLIHHNGSHLKSYLSFYIFKTYLIKKMNKPKGSTLKIYLISYQTKASILKSTGHS